MATTEYATTEAGESNLILFPSLSKADVTHYSCYYALLAVIAVVGVVGNGLVIRAILGHQHMRRPTHGFLLGLAVSDLILIVTHFLQQLSHLPVKSVVDVLGEWTWCVTSLVSVAAQMRVSAWTLVSETLLRLVAVRWPIFYRQRLGWNVIYGCTAIVWFASYGLSLMALPLNKANMQQGLCKFADLASASAATNVFVTATLAPLCIMTAVYSTIGILLRKRRNQVLGQACEPPNPQMTSREAMAKKREKKLVVMAAVLLGFFAIAWIPNAILNLSAIFCRSCSFSRELWALVRLMLYTNAAVNVFIYAGQNPEFRGVFKKDLKRLIGCFGRV